MLGRGGVLVLSAVAGRSQLTDIEQATPKILAAIVAGTATAAAVKLGFFKALWVAILAAKKFIVIGVVAIAAAIRKLFKRKQTPA